VSREPTAPFAQDHLHRLTAPGKPCECSHSASNDWSGTGGHILFMEIFRLWLVELAFSNR
jgi:hypothetical protein